MYNPQPLQVEVLPHAANWMIREVLEDDPEQFITRDVMPFYDHVGDSGLRLYVLEDIELPPFQKVIIPHGIAVRPPQGYETQIRPRSSAFAKKDVIAILGTIDQPYGGEIASAVTYVPEPVTKKVRVLEYGCEEWEEIVVFPKEPLKLKKGDRVTQLVVAAVVDAQPMRTPVLAVTSRGGNGWGSSGG